MYYARWGTKLVRQTDNQAPNHLVRLWCVHMGLEEATVCVDVELVQLSSNVAEVRQN